MKRIAVLSLLLLCGITLFAGPFGLEMGWSYDEIISSGAKKEFGNETLLSVKPVNPHSDFDSYLLLIDEEYGLYTIMAHGSMPFSILPSILVSTYNEIKDQLIQGYGEPRFSSDTALMNDDYFDMLDAIENNGEHLTSTWKTDELNIDLSAFFNDDGTPIYMLIYSDYKIMELIEAREQAKNASVL